jgi:hypothetical protein
VLVPRYKLSLCHTPIKPDLRFPGIGVFAYGLRDHEVRIIWYQSLATLIRLYPYEIFISCCFRKNSLVSNFFFSDFAAYQKNKNKFVISFCYCSKYISSIKNFKKNKRKEKSKKKIFQKDVYWILPQKTKQEKIGSNQLGIS